MRIHIIDNNNERQLSLAAHLRQAGWLCHVASETGEHLIPSTQAAPLVLLNMTNNTPSSAYQYVVNCAAEGSDETLSTEELYAKIMNKMNRLMYQAGYPLSQDATTIKMAATAKKYANSTAPVLITGETGTGKELMANFLHHQSAYAQGPFVAVNCAAIPDTMIEAILFGYEKGAFTNATQTYIGKFEQADQGTLFLDEVGEMPLDLQAKLLRVLQNNEVDRIGCKSPKRVNIRLICATNKNLAQEVMSGAFRADLFYRIHVMSVTCLPLRERGNDVALLAQYFTELYAQQYNKTCLLSENCLARLKSYTWPGNIRELQNVLQRAVILNETGVIESHDLDFVKFSQPDYVNFTTPTYNLHANEADMIVKVLRETKGRRMDAAKLLMISPRTLRYKISKLREVGIDIP